MSDSLQRLVDPLPPNLLQIACYLRRAAALLDQIYQAIMGRSRNQFLHRSTGCEPLRPRHMAWPLTSTSHEDDEGPPLPSTAGDTLHSADTIQISLAFREVYDTVFYRAPSRPRNNGAKAAPSFPPSFPTVLLQATSSRRTMILRLFPQAPGQLSIPRLWRRFHQCLSNTWFLQRGATRPAERRCPEPYRKMELHI